MVKKGVHLKIVFKEVLLIMKKTLMWVLTSLLILGIMTTGAFGYTFNEKSVATKKIAINRIDKTFTRYYEKFDGDSDRALEALVEEIPSVEIKGRTKSYFDIQDGKPVLTKVIKNGKTIYPEGFSIFSTMSDIQLNDTLVWDSDWNTYVFLGDWDWKSGQPDETNLQPWDMVGFYTTDPSTAKALEYMVRGYDTWGSRVIYYNTDTDSSSGDISKGTQTQYGVAFWHDETPVVNGTITVPLWYDSQASSYATVMTKYGHSWTDTNITGVGGSASISGGGFNISWDTGVYHWPDEATSYGEKVPPQ